MRRLICMLMLAFIALTSLPTLAQDAVFIPQPPDNVEIITPENANRLELLATLGRGEIRNMAWSPDESLFAVKTTTGIWIYEDLAKQPLFIECTSKSAVFDADWNKLAIHYRDRIDIWDLHSWQKQSVTVGSGKKIVSDQPIALSPNGLMLFFVVERDEKPYAFELWRWDVPQNQLKDMLLIDSMWVDEMSFSPRGDALLLEDDGTGSILALITDSFETLLPNQPVTYRAAFHPTEPIIAYFSYGDYDKKENSVVLFNYETQQDVAVYSIPTSQQTMRLFFSPKGEYLMVRSFSTNTGGELYRWDLATGVVESGSSEKHIEFDFDDPHLIQFSPDGNYLSIEAYLQSEIWDIETLRTVEPPWKGTRIRFNVAGRQVLTDNSLFSLENEAVVRQVTGNSETSVFSPTGKRLAIVNGYNGPSVSIYPVSAEGEPVQLSGYGHYRTWGFSPQGKYLLTQGGGDFAFWQAPFRDSISVGTSGNTTLSGTDEAIHFNTFNFGNGTLEQWWIDTRVDPFQVYDEGETVDLDDKLVQAEGYTLHHYAFDKDNGILIAAGGEDSGYFGGSPFLFLYDLLSGRYQYVYGHSGQINTLAFSPDGNTLATGSGYGDEYYESEDMTLRLWDVRRVNGVLKLTGRALFYYPDPVQDVVFDRTGRMIAVNAGSEISVRDTLTGREIFRHDMSYPSGLAFSPESRLLVSKDYDFLEIWNLETGELLASLPTLEWFTSIYFDPNGHWIATSYNSGVVRLYGVRGD